MPRVSVLCVCQCPGRERSHAIALGIILRVGRVNTVPGVGADANAVRTADGARPLHVAAGAGRRAALRALVRELSASVEARDGRGRTAMHWACRAGDVAALLCLHTELGANVDARDERGATPLMLAARQGHDAACRSLVDDLGADCNLTDEDGATATHHAAAHGRADALAVLPPVADALHVAAANDSRDVIERLVDGGASPNARDGRNATAAHWAADYDEVAALKKLQSLGGVARRARWSGKIPRRRS